VTRGKHVDGSILRAMGSRAFPLFWAFALCLALGWVGPAVAESPGRFRFWRQIDRGASSEEEILTFTLDSDIYAATGDGLPDLRILDGADGEAPYQIEREVEYREQRTRHRGQVEGLSLREEGNAIEIGLRLPKDSPSAEGFVFVTPQVDYERKVRVFGSDDGANWIALVPEGWIFDYSRYMDVSNREVPLPPNSFRRFKIIVEDATEQRESPYKHLARTFRGGKEEQRKEETTIQLRAFRIERIEFFWHTTQQHVEKIKKVEYPVAAFDQKTDAAKKQTILRVGMRREPLTALTIQTASRNFHRRAVVEVPVVRGPTTEWNAIGQATLSSLHFRDIHREQLSIEFPEQRREEYRIVIENEDNPPLEITGVKAEGNVYRVEFLAEAGKDYRVYYGSDEVEPPRYEATAVLATLRKSFPPRAATLGAQVGNAAYGGEPGLTVRKLLSNWVFLGSAICLMVVVLAWGLFLAGKRLENETKE
jgi:hypothetical protein